jgi:hypothetical protein
VTPVEREPEIDCVLSVPSADSALMSGVKSAVRVELITALGPAPSMLTPAASELVVST